PAPNAVRLFGIRSSDEKITFGGIVQAARKVSFVVWLRNDANTFRGLPLHSSIWIGREQKNSILALTVKLAGLDDAKVRYELAGYGTKDGAGWGKTPEQLEPEKK